ncbi:cytochrome b/b6 domain-containing protein [Oscillatoria salina]|uniref:cytochrome b/b6 domain-containing protein n=1 Tax=Oscillatoria salina TaxID=331517 RepID=UPI0013BAF41E|nr:cytochrome b/b6 domain-containing protein [Oscillatoria salina]MBZ8178783.1 cytochrome b/b6 domain-containing protein [Oscillatoria salina IIICB1]NET88224.1 cytochrome b/b6 domain-containing protein [Kamptonema sp. SIO1D9]
MRLLKPRPPYQPLLLRLGHGLTSFFVIAAILTAFWTYNTYDGRWGRIPLPKWNAIEGIHGTFGLFSLLIFPLFFLYAVHRGHKRLIQANSLKKLTQVGKPVWWYTLHRLTNTLTILALTFALFSGKMMDETWLPKGELDRGWYYAHLISWVVLVICISLHVLMGAKVGGTPLLMSMFHWRFRAKDSPVLWRENIRRMLGRSRISSSLVQEWSQLSFPLKVLEVIVFVSLVGAFILPLFKG